MPRLSPKNVVGLLVKPKGQDVAFAFTIPHGCEKSLAEINKDEKIVAVGLTCGCGWCKRLKSRALRAHKSNEVFPLLKEIA